MQRQAWRAALVAVVLLAACAPAGVGVAGAAGDDGVITRTTTFSLTPETPGEVDATVAYDVPDPVTGLTVSLPSEGTAVTVTDTDGFAATADGGYRWDGETARPTLTLAVDANRTRTRLDAREASAARSATASAASASDAGATTAEPPTVEPTAADGADASSAGYTFVDTGSWALVPVPRVGTQWRWRGGDVTLDRETRVDGAGVAGENVVYLGPSETYERRAAGQSLRLVVPAAASLRESPGEILGALVSASRTLAVGERDPTVRLFAAPTGVRWATEGLEYGGSDAWVRADARLDVAADVWVHEYVHTRQAFETTTGTRWLTEASAEYYAAYLALADERIGYDAFRSHLARGTRASVADAVLAEPSTWVASADYRKGALVVGALDRRIQLATDGTRSFADVFARLNDAGTVTETDFLDAVASVGGDDVRDAAARYTRTEAVPETWSAADYRRAFGTTPSRITYALGDDGYAVAGPWRNATAGSVPTLAVGETLTVRATVRNAGDRAGAYEVAIRRNASGGTGGDASGGTSGGPSADGTNDDASTDGEVLDAAGGTLDPGATASVSVSAAARDAGDYVVELGPRAVPVRVVRPTEPRVVDVSANRTRAGAGEPVGVRATVENPTAVPANATYDVAIDGERRTTWTPHLVANETRTATFVVTFPDAGTHTVTVADRTVSVAVAAGDGTGSETGGVGDGTGGVGDEHDGSGAGTTGGAPGFGLGVALAALLLVGARRVRGRGR
ncbi:hypothetical protein J2752_000029 [Halarchaeum rubridurum]|uniref:CARDB protein n=1 Tax=Halarchaeum rubridurum TaxID=489911 RepID=A0A830FVZ3_9EURY|nr:hypothetical protein [Halarchaeum rubridurum]MBP1953148.1 hypothetical protein [Halarchaeum rubridurum]GGM67522.1 hypothetical protein GCM10009017_17070 [Halarchaeum rubridurum]